VRWPLAPLERGFVDLEAKPLSIIIR
jgi:hypothetical protein